MTRASAYHVPGCAGATAGPAAAAGRLRHADCGPRAASGLPSLALSLLLSTLAVAAAATPAQAQVDEQRRVRIARKLQRSSVVVRSGRRSGGSGFVVGPERWVVTNAHVVRGAGGQVVLVRFAGDEQRRGRVVAYEPQRDLALIEVEGEVPATPLELGDSDEVEVGHNVLAFGSPFGLEGTLTQGIVSARRDLPAVGGGSVKGLIQTDAPINPGNSGGPLVNAKGKVIGVNTAILSRSGGSHGIGFAVPSNYIRELLARVRKGKRNGGEERDGPQQDRPRRVWLGIYGDDFRSRGVAGVRVQRVVPRGPAAKAGLVGMADRPPKFVRRLGVRWTGHIILAVDGQPVRNMARLRRLLAKRKPGDTVTLFVTVGPGVVSGEVQVRLQGPPERLRRDE